MHYVDGNETMQIKAEKFVSKYFNEKLPKWAVYHNLQHTIETVNACLEIGKGSNLNEDDLEILCIAAWFHDTGYMFKSEGHEEKSAEIAVSFLKENNYPSSKIGKIRDCIIATKITNVPQNYMEFTIRDSDLISLGREDYFKMNNLLKLEIEMRENKKISEFAWLKRSIHFLSSHIFLTEYAKLNFYPQLKKNLMALQKQIEDI
ncbi:MAG: HD domain-containing protein [Candidatus Kariarchaeaceae archaeon]|jgi:predicted metal-dependent HD superfamily phosphohydrolase